jgi:hypothetical protein
MNIFGQQRACIAALDVNASSAATWNPGANYPVKALAISGDGATVYAGGEFTQIGGQARNYVAALDAVTGEVTAWNANASNTIFDPGEISALAISADGRALYIGGLFRSIGGESRSGFAQFDGIVPPPPPITPAKAKEWFLFD